MVYVISHTGKALMPTSHHGKVKHLLRDGRARVVRREPFTIQLLYDNTERNLGRGRGNKTCRTVGNH